MSYTKCINANPYKTGSYVQRAMPNGVFQSDLTVNNFIPNTSLKDTNSTVDSPNVFTPGTSHVLTTSGTSAATALTSGIRAITVYARNNDAYIRIGEGTQTASATSMFVGVGDRVTLDVGRFRNPFIAVINGPTAAVSILQVTELS